MARKSKSAKNTGKSKASSGSDESEAEVLSSAETPESSGNDEPVILDAEVVDVTPTAEISPEDAPAEAEDFTEETEASSDKVSEEIVDESEGGIEASDLDDTETLAGEPDDTSELGETPELAVEPVPVVAEAKPARASSIPLFIGGLVAAGAGYLAAMMAQPAPVDTTSFSESITANTSQVETLTAEVAGLQNAPAPTVDLSGIEGDLGGLADQLSGLGDELATVRDELAGAVASFDETSNALSDRLTVLETAGPGESEAARATEEDLASFRAELERITSEAEQRVSTALENASEIETAALAAAAEAEQTAEAAAREAAEAAALAEKTAAVATLKTALESGQSYSDQIGAIGDVPDIIAANAETGVVTVVELQQTFADAARTALANAETIPQDASAGERLGAFFKQRTGARSLTPKDGDSADAILSRADAMVKQGDIGGALNELDGLGDAPKSAMQPWLDQATTRAAALAAAEKLNATN